MCKDCGGKKDSMELSTKAAPQDLQALVNELSRGGIQNLTINNYGSLSILGPQSSFPKSLRSGDVEAQGKWRKARIKVKNESEGTFLKVTLLHSYNSGDSTDRTEWGALSPNSETSTWETSFYDGSCCVLVIQNPVTDSTS